MSLRCYVLRNPMVLYGPTRAVVVSEELQNEARYDRGRRRRDGRRSGRRPLLGHGVRSVALADLMTTDTTDAGRKNRSGFDGGQRTGPAR